MTSIQQLTNRLAQSWAEYWLRVELRTRFCYSYINCY